MLLIQKQVLTLYPANVQNSESKFLPSVIFCKHNIPPGKRSIILQAYLQNIKKENCFCMAFYLCLIIPTGPTIGSSVVPLHILPEPTKDLASLPAGRLNYFMPYRNILFCTLSFMSESSSPHMSDTLYTRTPKWKSQCNRKLVVIGRNKLQILGNGGRRVFCSFACRFALDQAVYGFQQAWHFKRLGDITKSKLMHFFFKRICPISSD